MEQEILLHETDDQRRMRKVNADIKNNAMFKRLVFMSEAERNAFLAKVFELADPKQAFIMAMLLNSGSKRDELMTVRERDFKINEDGSVEIYDKYGRARKIESDAPFVKYIRDYVPKLSVPMNFRSLCHRFGGFVVNKNMWELAQEYNKKYNENISLSPVVFQRLYRANNTF
jgi:hypothetical protein